MQADSRANRKSVTPGLRLPWGRIAWLAGTAAAAVSGGFLVHGIASHWEAIEPLLRRASIPMLAISVTVYLLSAVAAAWVWIGWLHLLRIPMCWPLAMSIGLTSQIAKYIPGNVAHHLGKAALARQAGAPLFRVAGSILGELLAAPVLGVATLGLVLAIDPAAIPDPWTRGIGDGELRAVGVAAVAVIVLAAALSPRLAASVVRLFSLESCEVRPGPALRIVVSGCMMFTAAGLSLHGVVVALAPEAGIAPGLSVAVFTLAWTMGFLTPGAPAGLGVREVLIVAGLSPVIGPPAAVGAAVLHRLVSAIGDILAFALGCSLAMRSRPVAVPGDAP